MSKKRNAEFGFPYDEEYVCDLCGNPLEECYCTSEELAKHLNKVREEDEALAESDKWAKTHHKEIERLLREEQRERRVSVRKPERIPCDNREPHAVVHPGCLNNPAVGTLTIFYGDQRHFQDTDTLNLCEDCRRVVEADVDRHSNYSYSWKPFKHVRSSALASKWRTWGQEGETREYFASRESSTEKAASFSHSFSPNFYRHPTDEENYTVSSRPTSLLQAVFNFRVKDPDRFKEMLSYIFGATDPETMMLLEPVFEDVLEFAIQTDTVSNLDAPVTVWIDPDGIYTVEVWDTDEQEA